jgi:hypothetical protein
MYPSVEAWLKAEHPDLLGLFRNPGPSEWWRRAITNEISEEELGRALYEEAISEMLIPGTGTTSATYRWCSALRDAREAGKLPRPTQ